MFLSSTELRALEVNQLLGEVGLTLFTNPCWRVIATAYYKMSLLFVNTRSGNKIFEPVIVLSVASKQYLAIFPEFEKIKFVLWMF